MLKFEIIEGFLCGWDWRALKSSNPIHWLRPLAQFISRGVVVVGR